MDTAVTDPLTGLVLEGRYRLGERLARGGMSTVYAATDLRLDRTVAVKIMADHLVHDPTFVDRFTREAKAAAMLSHPNVVSVSDQGSDQGLVFLVMELVRGRTLRELLQARGRLTTGEAFAVMEPVLAGLSAAHRAGIVHRDIKPENVLIGHDGTVKVADFGLARAVVGTGQTSQTGGMLIGTVAYLSPEQLERGKADARSDVYAAGIVLYELLTGHPPYGGDTPLAVAYQHVHHDVPTPSAEVSGLAWQVDELVARTTRRDPVVRPLDAGAFAADLEDVRTDVGIPRVPVPTGRSTAGPGTLRPISSSISSISSTNRPSRPGTGGVGSLGGRHPSAPGDGTEVLPAVRARSGSRTNLLPGMGSAPTTNVGSARPSATARPRPGVPDSVRRRRTRLAVAIVALLAVTIGAVGWWLGEGRWTTVPGGLVGMTKDAAIGQLQEADLDATFADEQFSETAGAGTVIEADPDGGDAIRGSDVELTVSKGPERFRVDPAWNDLPIAEVQQKIDAAELPVTFTQQQASDENVPLGNVIGFQPSAGTDLKRGDAVTIVVSSGPAPVIVPDVAGQSADVAEGNLEDLGFVVAQKTAPSTTVAQGAVIGTDPEAGTSADRGSPVTITVSDGPPQVTMPDVKSKNVDDAKATLEGLGLKVDVQRPAGFGSRVRGQSIDPGASVDVGTTITLIVFI